MLGSILAGYGIFLLVAAVLIATVIFFIYFFFFKIPDDIKRNKIKRDHDILKQEQEEQRLQKEQEKKEKLIKEEEQKQKCVNEIKTTQLYKDSLDISKNLLKKRFLAVISDIETKKPSNWNKSQYQIHIDIDKIIIFSGTKKQIINTSDYYLDIKRYSTRNCFAEALIEDLSPYCKKLNSKLEIRRAYKFQGVVINFKPLFDEKFKNI